MRARRLEPRIYKMMSTLSIFNNDPLTVNLFLKMVERSTCSATLPKHASLNRLHFFMLVYRLTTHKSQYDHTTIQSQTAYVLLPVIFTNDINDELNTLFICQLVDLFCFEKRRINQCIDKGLFILFTTSPHF